MTEKRRAHEVLGAFLTHRKMSNRDFAQRVQLVRRHPSVPSGPQVSHWRCGQKVPDHDMRIWIEIASEGAVSADIWAPEKERRKMEKQQQSKRPRQWWFTQKGDEGQRYLVGADGVRELLKGLGYIPSKDDDELSGDYMDNTPEGFGNLTVWENVPSLKVSNVTLTHDVEVDCDTCQVWTVQFEQGFEAEVCYGVPEDKAGTCRALGSTDGLMEAWVDGDSPECWLDTLGMQWCDNHEVTYADVSGEACAAVIRAARP